MAGVIGAAVTTWATFAPCFLWIFLGAPYVERLRGNRTLAASLSTVTAAVVGTIASLAVTFGIHVLFDEVHTVTVFGGPIPVPTVSSLDVFSVVVAAAGFVALTRFRVNVAVGDRRQRRRRRDPRARRMSRPRDTLRAFW